MKTRIFRVKMEHLKYGINWSEHQLASRTAAEAIRRAEAAEPFPTVTRAYEVHLVAEAE